MRELQVQLISANVTFQQSGGHFYISGRERFATDQGWCCSLPARQRNLRLRFDTNERDEVTRQRPTPIEQSVVPIKFSVVDRVSFALERVFQITVSREKC